jgi:hypothetical protein
VPAKEVEMRKLRKMDVVSVEYPPMIAIVSEVLPDGRVRLLAPETRSTGGPDDDGTDLDDSEEAYTRNDYPKLEWDLYDPEELEFIDTLPGLADPCYNMQRDDDIQTVNFLKERGYLD